MIVSARAKGFLASLSSLFLRNDMRQAFVAPTGNAHQFEDCWKGSCAGSACAPTAYCGWVGFGDSGLRVKRVERVHRERREQRKQRSPKSIYVKVLMGDKVRTVAIPIDLADRSFARVGKLKFKLKTKELAREVPINEGRRTSLVCAALVDWLNGLMQSPSSSSPGD
jgi:hypothetical protein